MTLNSLYAAEFINQPRNVAPDFIYNAAENGIIGYGFGYLAHNWTIIAGSAAVAYGVVSGLVDKGVHMVMDKAFPDIDDADTWKKVMFVFVNHIITASVSFVATQKLIIREAVTLQAAKGFALLHVEICGVLILLHVVRTIVENIGKQQPHIEITGGDEDDEDDVNAI